MLGRCMFDKELRYSCKKAKNGREGTKQGVRLTHKGTVHAKKELIILTDKGSSLWNSIILTVYCFTFSLQPRSTIHPRLQMYNLKENWAPKLTILSQNVSNYNISLK